MEVLREVFYSIKQNKIRTLLSGFGISWGIFILVILLGTGKGFQSSVMNIFSAFAQKSIYVYGGITSENYKNTKSGTATRFNNFFIQNLKTKFNGVAAISPEISSSLSVNHNGKTGFFRVIGVTSSYLQIKILKIKDKGRLFNPTDDSIARNVVVIGENVATSLFGKESALNKTINIKGLHFKVIGVLKNDDIFSASEINSIYLPYSSYVRNIDRSSDINAFCLYLKKNTDSKSFEEELRSFVAHKKRFAFLDKQALHIINLEAQTSKFEKLFKGLRSFIWIVGLCFLISGIVGVSNVMFIIIKERTSEIGIRMAVGATPRSIITLILTESIVVTAFAGVLGLIMGKGVLELINIILSYSESTLIETTNIDINSGVLALIILIIAGVFAGVFPAMKASKIQPVDAIRHEILG